MQYDPSKYETVKERKAKFYADHEDGRIVVESLSTDLLEYAYFKASVYLEKGDQLSASPRGVGYALEVRDKEVRSTRDGKEYMAVNFTSWTENCEESAIGRALDNAGYSGNKKASKEEMEKAARMEETMKKQNIADEALIAAVKERYPSDGFVQSVANGYAKYKSLTIKQREAIQSKMDQPYNPGDKAQLSNI